MSQPPSNDRINSSGLMRCCLETVSDKYLMGVMTQAEEGQILQCRFAPNDPAHRMIFEHGVWRWLLEDVTEDDEYESGPPVDDEWWLE